ncbi:MFS general substrate transporter, partial [Agrocybe pediades]
EGGLKGWIAVAGAFLIQFCTIGYVSRFTKHCIDYYNHVYLTDQNPIAVRFIGSVQLFFAFLLSVVAGKLMDSGYFRYVIHGGSVLYIVSLALLSFIGEEQLGAILACQSIGMGIGIGLVFVPTAIVPLYYFKRRKGLAMGIVISGGSLGGMIFPAALLPSRGFRGAVLITACVVLGFLAVGNGLSTYSAPPKQEKPAYPLPRIDLAKYSKEMGYLFAAGGYVVIICLINLFVLPLVMYLNLLGLEKGVDANTAFNTIIILSLSGIFGRVGFGFASDFVGPFNLMIPISGFLALMMFTTCTIQGPKSLGAYAFFYGFFAGGWFSLMITALSSLALRKTEAGCVPTRVGLVLSASSIAMLVSLLLQDGILTPNHIWAIPSAVGGVSQHFIFLPLHRFLFVVQMLGYLRWN